MRIKEADGIPLLCLFGKSVVLWLFNRLVMQAIDGDQTIWYIAFIALSLIVCAAFILMAKNKSAYINSVVGQVSAYYVGAIQAVFAINILVFCICDFSIFSFIGNYATLIVEIVTAAMIVAYILGSKAWLPIKILGSPIVVFDLIASVLLLKARLAYENANDYSLFDSFSTAFDVCDYASLGLNVICLILAIVWMSSKNISSENRQSINMI